MSAVARYRKKPVEVEAVHYEGLFPLEFLGALEYVRSAADGTDAILIDTLEGTMRAEVGDWIIRGVKGECYPCKPDIFEATRGILRRAEKRGRELPQALHRALTVLASAHREDGKRTT